MIAYGIIDKVQAEKLTDRWTGSQQEAYAADQEQIHNDQSAAIVGAVELIVKHTNEPAHREAHQWREQERDEFKEFKEQVIKRLDRIEGKIDKNGGG